MKKEFRLQLPEYLHKLFDKYKYVLLVCLVGLVLVLWPKSEKKQVTAQQAEAVTTVSDAALLEEKLASLLADMEGVGKCRVLLTLASSEETLYAYDQTHSAGKAENGSNESSQSELATVTADGDQTPVPTKTTAPTYQGAVVVCEGGDSAKVRLAVTETIRSLTGISSDHIVISKMKH